MPRTGSRFHVASFRLAFSPAVPMMVCLPESPLPIFGTYALPVFNYCSCEYPAKLLQTAPSAPCHLSVRESSPTVTTNLAFEPGQQRISSIEAVLLALVVKSLQQEDRRSSAAPLTTSPLTTSREVRFSPDRISAARWCCERGLFFQAFCFEGSLHCTLQPPRWRAVSVAVSCQ